MTPFRLVFLIPTMIFQLQNYFAKFIKVSRAEGKKHIDHVLQIIKKRGFQHQITKDISKYQKGKPKFHLVPNIEVLLIVKTDEGFHLLFSGNFDEF